MAVLGVLQGQSARSHTLRPVPATETIQNKRIKEEDEMTYEPKLCIVCGKEFIPRRCNQKSCGGPECKREVQRMARKAYIKKNYLKVRDDNRKYMQRMRGEIGRTPKPDTIVAEGYAERQIARSLELAGKVRTEL